MNTVGKSTGENDTVYIVDPDEKHSAKVSLLLTDLGYHVVSYSCAEELLDDLEPDTKGCVISEIDLPGIGGLALLDRLKIRRVNLPVIFITGHENLSTAVQACRMRVADYLVKPFVTKALVSRLRDVLDNRSTQNLKR
jgi:FixJ family two-component response regulator